MTHNNDQNDNKKKSEHEYMIVGLSIGLCLGVSLGAVFENTGAGISIGMCLGIAIGSLMDHAKNKKDKTKDEITDKEGNEDNHIKSK